MKRLIFNIIKLLISITLQCYMILTCPVFLSHEWGYKDIIAKVITLLGILLGEGGIYLLYTVKPLEDERQNRIYTIVYTIIHIVLFGIIIYAYIRQGFTHNWFPLLESAPDS